MRRSSAGTYATVLLILSLVTLALLAGCSGGKFVGSKASSKFHVPSCVWAKSIDSNRRVWFDTTAEAKKAGYIACGVCNPTDDAK